MTLDEIALNITKRLGLKMAAGATQTLESWIFFSCCLLG